MKILEQYKEGDYLITKYENGAIVKQFFNEDYKQEDLLTKQELRQLELEEKIEYLTTLLEIQGGLINV